MAPRSSARHGIVALATHEGGFHDALRRALRKLGPFPLPLTLRNDIVDLPLFALDSRGDGHHGRSAGVPLAAPCQVDPRLRRSGLPQRLCTEEAIPGARPTLRVAGDATALHDPPRAFSG